MMRESGMSSQDELLLQTYLDGELGKDEAEVVERRLKENPRWAQAERELREMLGSIVAGFVEIDGNVRRSQVGSLPAAKPQAAEHRTERSKKPPETPRSSLTLVGASEIAREIVIVSGLTIERKVFSVEGRKVILEIATTASSEQVDAWLASEFISPPGMSTLSRRLPNNVGIRISGEMAIESLASLKLQVA